MTTILIPGVRKKYQHLSSEDTAREIVECYGGQRWVKEVNELFPETKLGCINYGYWDHVPEKISLKEREHSQINLYRHLFAFAGLARQTHDVKVLEMGGGRGHGVFLLHTMGYNAFGIDMVQNQIEKCMHNHPEIKEQFKQATVNKTGFKSNTFDSIISVEAAQHFHSFLAFAKESHRVLKPHGKIALTTFFFPSKKAQKLISDTIPTNIAGTHRTIPIETARKHLLNAGFTNIKIKPIGNKVFAGFCKWASQSMSQVNHTPLWVEAYKNNLIEYYMITAEKL